MNSNNLEDLKRAISASNSEKRKKSFRRELGEWISSLVTAVVVVLLLQSFLFTLIRVDGDSMNPTLLDKERLFVTVYDVKFGEIERGDVVICRYPDRGRTSFVKRVVALPGDTVYRADNVTHVVYETADGSVDEALDEGTPFSDPDYAPYVLGENEYFVVGDNRYYSHDSRDWNDNDPSRDVGPITRDMITGHVRSVIWPPSAIRTVE